MSVRTLFVSWFVMLGVLAWPATSVAQTEPALVPVEQFHAQLLGIMRDGKTLGFAGRKARFADLLAQTFDRQLIARRVLSPHWKAFDNATRSELHDLVFEFATSILAVQFTDYDNQHFETLFSRKLKRGMVRVRSHFHLDDGEPPVKVDFVLRPVGETWKIADFWFEGVSGTTIHHAEFNAVLRKGGKDALVKALRTKIDGLIAKYR
ncbi:MAG: hypothetical protein HOI95_21735 [Chromatiales bacterium]|mgnify:CR=1 FL=1|nr:hypothetical protein [Chromatiales bacterium]